MAKSVRCSECGHDKEDHGNGGGGWCPGGCAKWIQLFNEDGDPAGVTSCKCTVAKKDIA